MTVSTTIRKTTPASGDGANKYWPFDFKSPVAAEVYPYLIDQAGVATLITTDYVVSINSDQEIAPGGIVTYPVSGAPISSDYKVMLVRVTALTQGVDLTLAGNFHPDVIEGAIDRNMLVAQEQAEDIARSVKIPITDVSGVSVELPSPSAGAVLAWNALGTALVNGTLSGEVAVGAAYRSEEQIATAGQTVFTLTTFTYTPGLRNLVVHINGVRQAPSSYTESNGSTVTFSAGLDEDDLVQFTSADTITTAGNTLQSSIGTEVLYIASGVITITGSFHVIDTEAGAGTDFLDTISGGTDGQRLVLMSANSARDPTLSHGVGNIILAGGVECTLGDTTDTIELIYRSDLGNWYELSRSDNS